MIGLGSDKKYQPAWGGFWGHFSNDWVYFWSLKVVFEFLSDLSRPGLEIVSEILSPVGPPKKRINFEVFKNMKNAYFVFWPPNHHLRSTRQSLTFEYLDPPWWQGAKKVIWPIFLPFQTISRWKFFVVKNFLGLASSFGALLVGQLVVVARGLYLATHLFTLCVIYK